jgi:two-component system chemotaxis sensor kinase CheA
MIQNAEFIKEFVDEAAGHIETLESSLIHLAQNDGREEIMHEIFRAVHSIKGTAGFFGLRNIVGLAHVMESLVAEMRDRSVSITHEIIDELLSASDCLKTMIGHVETSEEHDISAFVNRLSELLHPADRNASNLSDNTTDTALVMSAPDESTGDERKKQQSASSENTIRVHVSLLNDLLNLASEMVLGRNQLLRFMGPYRREISGLDTMLQNIDGLTTEMQEKIMQTRMQPIGKVFNKFPRMIREISRKVGKDIDLQIEGKEVELDKSIIEKLVDPLTHLIRNAIDHGIEPSNARDKLGKPSKGCIVLKAYHRGGQVNIDIMDDGAGIHIDKVEKKALENGMISTEEASVMGDREILELLFRPGFSTNSQVTDISGRGVGLDVVKVNIEKLGGSVEVITRPNHGTTFRLTLPLTVAIIPSLIVEVAGQRFAIPQINVQEMVRIKPDDSTRKIEHIGGSLLLRLREKLLPIVHLSDLLGLNSDSFDAGKINKMLIIKTSFKRFGLMIDFIHDGEEILVKSLPGYLTGCQSYSGVTILGDGKPAMILDAEGITRKANLRFLEHEQETLSVGNSADFISEQQNLLLFRCSGPEIFCIDLSLVARVEKINLEKIESIGDKEFIQFRGEALRVIRPEHYLPVSRSVSGSDYLYVIVPKLVKYPIGIVIENIIDTVVTSIQFHDKDISAKGLFGSAVLDGRLVIFLNMYELFEMADPDHYTGYKHEDDGRDGKTLLLVEDTPFFMKVEKNYLESENFRVLTAVNGKEAWKILMEQPIDAVVSDIHMPVMDGFELVKRIRSDKHLSSLPVIAVTSITEERMINMGMEAGFDYYVTKLDKERMLENLKLAFRKRTDMK